MIATKLPPKKIRKYPEKKACDFCGSDFKPSKDKKRFCGRSCFHAWEKAKAKDAASFKPDNNRAIKSKSAQSISTAQKVDEYAERCKYWLNEFQSENSARSNLSGKRQARLPLVLSGHGVGLKIESGTLIVSDGLTHFPQRRIIHRFFPGNHNTPSRIVLLGGSGAISVAVMRWLNEQSIPLVILDFQGNEAASICSSSGVVDYELGMAQIYATRSREAIGIAKLLISRKLEKCLDNIDKLPLNKNRTIATEKIKSHLIKIQDCTEINNIFTLEATAALSYFKSWQGEPLKWSAKKEFPEYWRTLGNRESPVSNTNRHASHPMNAILNYGYSILESQVRIALGIYGFDFNISYLHARQHRRDSLVYDLMEPLRPVLDARLFEFALAATFTDGDFNLTSQGVCRLNPELARRITQLSVPDSEVQALVSEFRDYLLELAAG